MLTNKQKNQLEWVNKWEFDYINASRLHCVTCKDCKESKVFGAASSVRNFIINFHAGHNTNYIARKN